MRATAPFNLTRLRKMGATSSSVTMLGGSRKGPAGRLARKIANADQLEIRDRSSRSSAGALMDCDAQRKRPHSAANPAPATLATFKAREMAVEANDLCAIATPRDPNGGTRGERAAARQSCSYQSYCPALGERIFLPAVVKLAATILRIAGQSQRTRRPFWRSKRASTRKDCRCYRG
jgi:hypothetical protein